MRLYAIYQRTQSESKSQPDKAFRQLYLVCMQSIKEHNLKANHNVKCYMNRQISLYAIYQRTQSESKSQQVVFIVVVKHFCMQSIKEHNLKANHNYNGSGLFDLGSVCNLSKNTIWKQITTKQGGVIFCDFLYAIYQRTQSESKSQQFIATFVN